MFWVKLLTGYHRDMAIATGDDAMEVMFTRGLAYCGEAESGGFIPDVIIPSLTRKPLQAMKIADRIAATGLWEKTTQKKAKGYEVINWHIHQKELEVLVERRKRDADRKRKVRAQERHVSAGLSADTSADSRRILSPTDIEVDVDAAAAAKGRGGGGKIPLDQLPDELHVLRARFAEFTALEHVSFTSLTIEQVDAIVLLIDAHGDARLLEVAKSTKRQAAFVQAFIPTWSAMGTLRTVRNEHGPRCQVCSKTTTSCRKANEKLPADDRCEGTAA